MSSLFCAVPHLLPSYSWRSPGVAKSSFKFERPLRASTRFFVIRCSSITKDMAESTDSSLYPLHRSKILHLVRHGQGHHNVAGEKDFKAYMSYEFLDASLTPLGWQQVDNLRKHIQKNGIASRIELVVTSPLMRTMQTAVGVFGGGGYIDGVASPPLMVAGAGKSDRAAISSTDCPPFLAVEWCREHIGVHPCDKRKRISEYQPLFPAIDFSLIETDEDILWHPDVREKEEDIATRGRAFLNWLLTRKEKEIAIVSHSGFLIHTLALFGKDCHPLVRNEIHKAFLDKPDLYVLCVYTHSKGAAVYTQVYDLLNRTPNSMQISKSIKAFILSRLIQTSDMYFVCTLKFDTQHLLFDT